MKALSFIGALSCLLLCGCLKSRLNGETTSAFDLAQSQFAWHDIARQALGAMEVAVVDTTLEWNGCASILRDTLGVPYPLSFTIDFGTNNCLGLDGRLRRGRLICELNAPWTTANARLTVIPDGYALSNQATDGVLEITYLGLRGGVPHLESRISNGTISAGNNPTITWEAVQILAWEEGYETGYFNIDTADSVLLKEGAQLDDVFMVDEVASGINTDGRAYRSKTASDLRLAYNCSFITEGNVSLVPEALKERTLDYGDSRCDSEVQVEIEGEFYGIDIRD